MATQLSNSPVYTTMRGKEGTVLVRLLLVEDHNLVRAGLRSLLKDMPNIEVVGEASDGREAVAEVQKNQPDVVLMDIVMSGLNGIEATSRIKRQFPRTKVIMLSVHSHEEYIYQSLRSGASGYLLKDAAPAELELALQAVVRGEIYLSPAISTHVVVDYLRQGGIWDGPMERLTARQREILQLLAEGHSSKEIAEALHISVKTVLTHRAELMDRLGIHDVPGLVRYAIRVGLVPPND